MSLGLRRVYLEVEDLRTSLKFYNQHLGMMVLRQADLGDHLFALLEAGDAELLLSQQVSTRRRKKGQPASDVVIGIGVPDVDQLCRELALRGVTVAMPAHDGLWGERCALIVDPDGYRVMLIAAAESV